MTDLPRIEANYFELENIPNSEGKYNIYYVVVLADTDVITYLVEQNENTVNCCKNIHAVVPVRAGGPPL